MNKYDNYTDNPASYEKKPDYMDVWEVGRACPECYTILGEDNPRCGVLSWHCLDCGYYEEEFL